MRTITTLSCFVLFAAASSCTEQEASPPEEPLRYEVRIEREEIENLETELSKEYESTDPFSLRLATGPSRQADLARHLGIKFSDWEEGEYRWSLPQGIELKFSKCEALFDGPGEKDEIEFCRFLIDVKDGETSSLAACALVTEWLIRGSTPAVQLSEFLIPSARATTLVSPDRKAAVYLDFDDGGDWVYSPPDWVSEPSDPTVLNVPDFRYDYTNLYCTTDLTRFFELEDN